MADQWFYMKAGNRFGPVTPRILRSLAQGGEIQPTDLVSREGSGTWVDAGRVKGLFSPKPTASRTPALPLDDDQYALDVASVTPSIRTDPPEPEGSGKLELDAASRFFLLHPLGLPTWVVGGVLATFVLVVLLIDKDRNSPSPTPDLLLALMAGLFVVMWLGTYVWLRVWLGWQTACPRCNRWFSKLLIGSDAQVVASREEMHTYTGQAAIRDRNYQVTGYIDEQRTVPITVKTVVGQRKYRCGSCTHHWEVCDVGRVMM